MNVERIKYFIDKADDETVRKSMKIFLDELEELFSFNNEVYNIRIALEKAEKELRIGGIRKSNLKI